MSHVKTMEAPRTVAGGSFPETEEERQAVRNQLEHVLSTPYFKNSKRYPGLLRFVTERALSGEPGHLKERTLGVAVFGKEPDYDTNLDPVVRITATEIRKRLAQYYQEPGHEQEIRIDFPAGSYVPEFQQRKDTVSRPPIATGVRKWSMRIGIAAALAATLVLQSRSGRRPRHSTASGPPFGNLRVLRCCASVEAAWPKLQELNPPPCRSQYQP